MKEMIYSYKFRLYPNKKQETYLAKLFWLRGLAYNHFLYEKQTQCHEYDMDVNAAKNTLKYKSARNVDYNSGVACKVNEKSLTVRATVKRLLNLKS